MTMPTKRTTEQSARKPVTRRATKSRVRRASKKVPVKQGIPGAGQAPAGFLLVNMMPKSLSGETSQDSEPHLTVNPANALQIVGTAFTPNPGGGSFAPL